MVAFAVSNDNGLDVAAVNSNGSTATPTIASLTTSVADCLRISIIAASSERVPVGTFSGHTLLVTNSYASAGMISVQYKALPTAGTDTGVSTTQTSSYWVTTTFAIAPTSSAISGTAAATLGTLTGTSAAKVDIAAAASSSLGALAGTSAGTVAIAAVAAKTLGSLTGTSAATIEVRAAAIATLGALTGSSAAPLRVAGAGA